MKENVKFAIVVFGLFWFVILNVAMPVSWFDGHAKSAYLKKTQGIDIPWYEATWLDVNVNSISAEIGPKK